MNSVYTFNNTILNNDTILKTREYFANNCLAIIKECEDGIIHCNDINKLKKYELANYNDFINGKNDNTLYFLQKAYYLQTGKSIALLNF